MWVKAGLGCGELPIRLGVVFVSSGFPGGDFLNEVLLVGDAPIETLTGQKAEFGFSHIEPTAVLWRVVPLEPFDQTARVLRGKRLIE